MKNIQTKLRDYGQETDLNVIKQITVNKWWNSVKMTFLKKNGEKCIENCHTMTDDGLKIYTKTKYTHEALLNEVCRAEPKR